MLGLTRAGDGIFTEKGPKGEAFTEKEYMNQSKDGNMKWKKLTFIKRG
jgi:hypothetical protein